MLGEAKQLLTTPEGTPVENLTLQPVMDLVEEFYSRLKNIAVEVCVCEREREGDRNLLYLFYYAVHVHVASKLYS